MALLPLIDGRIYLNQYELSGKSNKLQLDWNAEPLDATVFGPAPQTKSYVAGRYDGKVTASGFLDFGTLPVGGGTTYQQFVDPIAFPALGSSGNVMTFAPALVDQGVAYLLQVSVLNYKFLGELGPLIPWNASFQPSPVVPGGGSVALPSQLVRGLFSQPGQTKTATGTGTVSSAQPAVVSGQNVWGTLHVLAASGTTPNLAVTIQSAPSSGFGSPTTRLTFQSQTAIGYDFQKAPGPITDTFWRCSWTITGTTPSFTFVVGFGIA